MWSSKVAGVMRFCGIRQHEHGRYYRAKESFKRLCGYKVVTPEESNKTDIILLSPFTALSRTTASAENNLRSSHPSPYSVRRAGENPLSGSPASRYATRFYSTVNLIRALQLINTNYAYVAGATDACSRASCMYPDRPFKSA